jgi:hypothetical protein
MVATSRSISPSSRISRRLALGGPASHCRSRNAVSPIRNCQNRRMARDLLRKGRANSGPELRRLGQHHAVRLGALRRANRQSLRPRPRQQMSSSFQALLCSLGVRPHDRRNTQDTKKFPPLHVNPPATIVSGQLSALIGAGFAVCDGNQQGSLG